MSHDSVGIDYLQHSGADLSDDQKRGLQHLSYGLHLLLGTPGVTVKIVGDLSEHALVLACQGVQEGKPPAVPDLENMPAAGHG